MKLHFKILAVSLFFIGTHAGAQQYHVFDNYADGIKHTGFVIHPQTLFPDSTVKVAYINDKGVHGLQYAFYMSAGEVFDPGWEYYDRHFATRQDFMIDSIGLMYRYHYVPETGAAPDTLIFQFYDDTANGGKTILTGKLSDPTGWNVNYYALMHYNFATNTGKGSFMTYKYALGAKDSSQTVSTLRIPVNGITGRTIGKGHLFAYTVSFVPGYKYQPGDTTDPAFAALRPHSSFNIMELRTDSKMDTYNYENGLTVVPSVRYNISQAWNGYYIPGGAWINYNSYLWTKYYTRAVFTDESAIHPDNEDQVFHIYPNPAADILTLDGKISDDCQFEIYGSAGIAVKKGAINKQSPQLKINDLPTGLYYIRVQTKKGWTSQPFQVIH